MKRRLPLGPLVLVLLLGVLFYACRDGGPTGPSNPGGNDTTGVDTTGTDTTHTDTTRTDTTKTDTTVVVGPRDCKADPVVFTEYLLDPSLIKVVVPIGSLGGGNTELVGRSYIHPKDGLTGQRLPVRAPADLEIMGVKHYDPTNGSPPAGYVYDWSLIFDAGCGVRMDLYHIKDVSPRIKAKYDTTISTSSAFNPIPFADRIKFKAGDTIGWYMTGPNAVAFDFIVNNDSVTNQFVNQARYVARNSNILHVVCPYDLYAGPKKAAYYNLLGTVAGQTVPGAGCGTLGDAAFIGTPRGQWFFDSAFTAGPGVLKKEGHYGDPLPILYGPDSTIFVGHLGPANNIRIERSNPTWLALDKVTASHCYQAYSTPTTASGWVWLSRVHSAKMNVAFSETGACPVDFPGTGFKSYFR
jgi:hypothetical protein